MRKNSQNMLVLSTLLSGTPLTTLSAMMNLGVGRLSARIRDLRQTYGQTAITTTMKVAPGRKRYASYKWNFESNS